MPITKTLTAKGSNFFHKPNDGVFLEIFGSFPLKIIGLSKWRVSQKFLHLTILENFKDIISQKFCYLPL